MSAIRIPEKPERLDQLSPRQLPPKKSPEIEALYTIVDKLDSIEGKMEFFSMRAALNEKLRAEDIK